MVIFPKQILTKKKLSAANYISMHCMPLRQFLRYSVCIEPFPFRYTGIKYQKLSTCASSAGWKCLCQCVTFAANLSELVLLFWFLLPIMPGLVYFATVAASDKNVSNGPQSASKSQ